jgi:hypothetical protein
MAWMIAAARPFFVTTISSRWASSRYCENWFLTSFSGTIFMLSSPAGTAREPCFGVGFADYAVNYDFPLGLAHVVVNAKLIHTQPERREDLAAESFDAARALSSRVVAQVFLDAIEDLYLIGLPQSLQVFLGAPDQLDLEWHSPKRSIILAIIST